MNAVEFVAHLTTFRLENVFNPYVETCDFHDRSDASLIRRRNLVNVLEAMVKRNVDTIWFGRDFGWRGGRRTGLALTDEVHLFVLGQEIDASVEKATTGGVVKERTASEIWRVLKKLPDTPFLWNAFPFHPYVGTDPFTNRCHTTAEFRHCESIIDALLHWLKPKRIIALGKDAERALRRFGKKCAVVRHPSFGGHVDFRAGIARLYRLPEISLPATRSTR
jgi:hypothetical protein